MPRFYGNNAPKNLKYTFDDAVENLDQFMQEKTVHSTQAILLHMSALCMREFTSPQDQNDFANICANFDKYTKALNKTSWGRKEFEKAWEEHGFQELPKKMVIDMETDPLPESFGAEDDLEAENRKLKQRLNAIKEMVNSWD